MDFSSCVVCQLDRMNDVKAFTSCEIFFEQIFSYVEKNSNDATVWNFSNTVLLRHGSSMIQRLVLSLLPKNLEKEIQQLCHYAVVDIGIH